MNVKIINPIYLYPQLKTSYYIVVENNKNYIFGANKKDSNWVFSSNKLTGKINRFNYSTKNYKFFNLKNTIKNTSDFYGVRFLQSTINAFSNIQQKQN